MVFILKTAKIDSRLVYHLKLLHLFIDGKTVVFFTAWEKSTQIWLRQFYRDTLMNFVIQLQYNSIHNATHKYNKSQHQR